jgi:hypothetical protein
VHVISQCRYSLVHMKNILAELQNFPFLPRGPIKVASRSGCAKDAACMQSLEGQKHACRVTNIVHAHGSLCIIQPHSMSMLLHFQVQFCVVYELSVAVTCMHTHLSVGIACMHTCLSVALMCMHAGSLLGLPCMHTDLSVALACTHTCFSVPVACMHAGLLVQLSCMHTFLSVAFACMHAC